MKRVTPTPTPIDPMLPDALAFGTAIRAARTSAGLSLADAAVALGLAKQTLSDLETAKGSVGLPTALHVARELGVAIFGVPAAEREQLRRLIAQSRQLSNASPSVASASANGTP